MTQIQNSLLTMPTTLTHCRKIIWDWNGTLLNDLDVCIEAINRLLQRRRLAPMTRERYLEIFTFPVQHYYTEAGFDFVKEPYERVAVEFMDHYLTMVREAGLHQGAGASLEYFRNSGKQQIILSAMEQTELRKLAGEHNIAAYFSHIFGISDHLAHGKISIAGQALRETGFRKEETCLIGDTLHDAEVSSALGIHCLLVADGHQSESRLSVSGYPVIRSLKEIGKVFG